MKTSHWLVDAKRETWFMLMPLFLPVLIVAIFKDYFAHQTEVTALWWLLLVLLIDVSHVYSTLFRFYWEPKTFQQHRKLLILIPLVAFSIGVLIHWFDSFLFWRLLAYAALYHFVRQQYGFVRLYSRKQLMPRWSRWLDAVVIYAATLYPVAYWHIHLTDSLAWFVPHDFIQLNADFLDVPLALMYGGLLCAYVIKEIALSLRLRDFNLPKNGIVLGTVLSWYAGIVWFKGDLTFTLLNVVAHGIPYMGLVWLYGEKKGGISFTNGAKGIAIFMGTLIVLAYAEELFWDVLVWKDHPTLFPFFTSAAPLSNPIVLSLVVPLLVLPQITHYVLDGFIWRFSKDSTARIESGG